MTYIKNELAIAEYEILKAQQTKEKIVNEEFKIWKKTVPLLYDVIYSSVLENPGVQFSWLPGYRFDLEHLIVDFIVGMNKADSSQISMGTTFLPPSLVPDGETERDVIKCEDNKQNGEHNQKLKINSSSSHKGMINKLSLSREGKKLLCFGSDCNIILYDIPDFENQRQVYKHHTIEGFCLDWVDNENFISGSNDSLIAFWNLYRCDFPEFVINSHKGSINSISINRKNTNIFASVSNDHTTQFHDKRAQLNNNQPVIKIDNKHVQKIIEFHNEIETLYAVGGNDNIISLFDLRNYKFPLREFYGHNDTVVGLKWNSLNNDNSLISYSLDNKIIFWNMNKLHIDYVYPKNDQLEKSKKKSIDKVDPCLEFIHAGHINGLNDFAYHNDIKNLYASVSDDFLIEVWMPKDIYSSVDLDGENDLKKKENSMNKFSSSEKD